MSSVTFCCSNDLQSQDLKNADLAQDLLVGHGGKLSRIRAKDYFGQKRTDIEVEPQKL